jgi:cobalt-zinc-cadmium efflux system outer membrane protein
MTHELPNERRRVSVAKHKVAVTAVTGLVVALGLRAAAAQDSATDEKQPKAPAFYAEESALRAYVGEALEKNPAMQESLARYRAALEVTSEVNTLPDPMFTFGQAIRSVETRVGPQRNTFVLSQAFPWFGKLDLREQVAMQEALARFDMFSATEREVIVQVKRAYYELAYVDRALAIAREEQSLLEHYEALAQTRYSTGQGLQQGVIKIQAEITRVLSRLDLLAQQRATLEARLNTLMDRPPGSSLPPTEPLSVPDVTLDLDALYELGAENRQELKAAEKRIEKSERSIELADKVDWPDFFIGVGLINVGKRTDTPGVISPPPDNGKNAVSISAGISLPIWRGKYDASMREASDMLLAERSGYASVRNDMEYSIRDQVVRIETFQDQIRLFENVLIPQSEETLRSTEAAYETGQLGVLDLLDSERTLLNVRLVNARYYSDLLSALANLERAIGTQFPE